MKWLFFNHTHAGCTTFPCDVCPALLTPFCLALPQLCLPAGLRLLPGNCRNLTAWILKAITCFVEHTVFPYLWKQMKNWVVISIMLIFNFLGGYFLIDHVTLFKRLFWSHVDMKHYILSHFPTWIWGFCHSSLGLDSWALLLPLLSKPSIVKPPENITVLFLNMLSQISPKKQSEQGSMIKSDLQSKGSHSMHPKGKQLREKGSFVP